MARIPLPSRVPQPVQSGAYTAQDVVPFQDQSGEQMQQLGRGIMVAGAGLSRLGDELDTQVRTARIKEADALNDEQARRAVQGYLGLQGKEAVDGRQAAEEAVKKARTEAGALLQNDATAADLFGRSADARQVEALLRIDAHHAKQSRAYLIGETKARAKAFAGSAIDSFDLQGTNGVSPFDVHLASMIGEVRQLSQLAGEGPEQRRAAELEATSEVHNAVVDRLVTEGRTQEAQKHLERAAQQIDPSTRTRLQDVVKRASDNDVAVRRALELMAPRSIDLSGAKSWADAFQLQEDARLQQAADAVETIDAQFMRGELSASQRARALGEVRSIEEQRQREFVQRAGVTLRNAEDWLRSNPTRPVTAMPEQLRVEVEAFALDNQVLQFAQTRGYATNPETYAELLSAPGEWWEEQDPAAFFLARRGELNERTMDWALNRIAVAKKVAPPADMEKDRRNKLIELAAKDVGVLPKNRKPNEAEATRYDRFFVSALSAAERDPKRPLDEVLRDMKAATVREGNYFALDPKERQQASIVAPSGREVFLKHIVDEQGEPLVESILADIREQNAELRAAGKVQLPETMQTVAQLWDEREIGRRETRKSSLADALAGKGFDDMAGRVRALRGPIPSSWYIRSEEAQAITGLSAQDLEAAMEAEGIEQARYRAEWPMAEFARWLDRFQAARASRPPAAISEGGR